MLYFCAITSPYLTVTSPKFSCREKSLLPKFLGQLGPCSTIVFRTLDPYPDKLNATFLFLNENRFVIFSASPMKASFWAFGTYAVSQYLIW